MRSSTLLLGAAAALASLPNGACHDAVADSCVRLLPLNIIPFASG